jgi:hypothetical protein
MEVIEMSLKAIEMQVALPRSIDAAKLQEQLSQRGQLMNDQANVMVRQEEVKHRTTVVKQEQKENAGFQQHRGNSEEQTKEKGKQQKKNSQHLQDMHPYKGNFIDFSG